MLLRATGFFQSWNLPIAWQASSWFIFDVPGESVSREAGMLNSE